MEVLYAPDFLLGDEVQQACHDRGGYNGFCGSGDNFCRASHRDDKRVYDWVCDVACDACVLQVFL